MISLKEKVREILSRVEYARNDDNYLIVKTWKDYYITTNLVKDPFPIKNYEELFELLGKLPNPDDIIRVRRKIQSEGEFLPTNELVIEKRKLKEKRVRKDLGYN